MPVAAGGVGDVEMDPGMAAGLTHAVRAFVASVQPIDSEHHAHLDLIAQLQQSIVQLNPDLAHARVVTLGSSSSGLLCSGTGLDLTLLFEALGEPSAVFMPADAQKALVRRLATGLWEARAWKPWVASAEVDAHFGAPALRLHLTWPTGATRAAHAPMRVAASLTVCDRPGVWAGLLVRTYMACDPRARDLCLFVKCWARRRGLVHDGLDGDAVVGDAGGGAGSSGVGSGGGGASSSRAAGVASSSAGGGAGGASLPGGSGGTGCGHALSSHAWVLLVIFYLQTCPHTLLPVLQDCVPPNARRRIVGAADGSPLDCSFASVDEAERASGWRRGAARVELGELLRGFFTRFAAEFLQALQASRSGRPGGTGRVISVRTGRLLPSPAHSRSLLAIEDPFDTRRDLGAQLSPRALEEIHSELRDARDQIGPALGQAAGAGDAVDWGATVQWICAEVGEAD